MHFKCTLNEFEHDVHLRVSMQTKELLRNKGRNKELNMTFVSNYFVSLVLGN